MGEHNHLEIIIYEEPHILWCDVATRLLCMCRVNPLLLTWCGYVCTPRGNRYWRKGRHHRSMQGISVHGGVTFADDLYGDGEWWLGFDCAHPYDEIPYDPEFDEKMKALAARGGLPRYEWDFEKVMAETSRLAASVKEGERK